MEKVKIVHKVFLPQSYGKCAKLQQRDGQSQRNAESTADTKTSPEQAALEQKHPCPASGVTESQNVRGWKGPLWVI